MQALSRVLCLVGVLTLALVSATAGAAPTPAPVRAELEALLAELKARGCRMARNGSWHSADEARAHVLRKLAYLEERTTLTQTEQVIEQAASKSSSSGKPYQVQCGQAPAQPSRDWLLNTLARQRQAAAR